MEGRILETIVVVLIICGAAGYLVRRYVKRAKNVGACECDNTECPIRSSDSEKLENFPDGINCSGKKRRDDFS